VAVLSSAFRSALPDMFKGNASKKEYTRGTMYAGIPELVRCSIISSSSPSVSGTEATTKHTNVFFDLTCGATTTALFTRGDALGGDVSITTLSNNIEFITSFGAIDNIFGITTGTYIESSGAEKAGDLRFLIGRGPGSGPILIGTGGIAGNSGLMIFNTDAENKRVTQHQ